MSVSTESNDARAFWTRTQVLTWGLLLAWGVASLLVPWFARDLEQALQPRWRGAAWLVTQALLPLYLLVIVVYALCMDRLERDYLDGAHVPGPEADSARP